MWRDKGGKGKLMSNQLPSTTLVVFRLSWSHFGVTKVATQGAAAVAAATATAQHSVLREREGEDVRSAVPWGGYLFHLPFGTITSRFFFFFFFFYFFFFSQCHTHRVLGWPFAAWVRLIWPRRRALGRPIRRGGRKEGERKTRWIGGRVQIHNQGIRMEIN